MWHISDDGEVRKCKAVTRECKYKNHFQTLKQAIEYKSSKDYLDYLKENTEKEYVYSDEEVDRIYLEEPEITVLLSKLAKKRGYKLDGLEFRLKTRESIREKIEVRRHAKTVRELKDIIRYTVVSSAENYYDDHKEVLMELLKDGIIPIKISNFWDGPGYKGINCQFERGGANFEVQFHTPESLDAKMKAHKMYEILRLIDPTTEQARELTAKMEMIFNQVPKPKRKEGD